MTNKEALLVLDKSCIVNYGYQSLKQEKCGKCVKCEQYTDKQIKEAIEVAIKALKVLITMEDDLK